MDNVFVPWEDVFVYADVEKANNFFPRTGFLPRALIHGCTRLAVKLDFITGLLIKATEMTGARAFRGVEANIGEVIAWRNMIWGLSDAMAKSGDPWTGGCILPGMEPAAAYQVLAPEAYVQIKNLIEKTVASGLIYLNSHAKDFKTADLRKYLDLYLRGSGGVDAVGRVKLMKLLWDAIGTEFGGRHELYEINYSGSHEEIRRYALFGAVASGQSERWKDSPRPAWRSTISTGGRRRTWSIPEREPVRHEPVFRRRALPGGGRSRAAAAGRRLHLRVRRAYGGACRLQGALPLGGRRCRGLAG